jgi:hypothetical protein
MTKEEYKEWADAEGCETGEAMGWLMRIAFNYQDYTSKVIRDQAVVELDRLVAELKDDFYINSDGELEDK